MNCCILIIARRPHILIETTKDIQISGLLNAIYQYQGNVEIIRK